VLCVLKYHLLQRVYVSYITVLFQVIPMPFSVQIRPIAGAQGMCCDNATFMERINYSSVWVPLGSAL